jgi:hypothetical protein
MPLLALYALDYEAKSAGNQSLVDLINKAIRSERLTDDEIVTICKAAVNLTRKQFLTILTLPSIEGDLPIFHTEKLQGFLTHLLSAKLMNIPVSKYERVMRKRYKEDVKKGIVSVSYEEYKSILEREESILPTLEDFSKSFLKSLTTN